MELEFVKLGFILVTTTVSICTFILLLRSKKTVLKIHSRLEEVDNRATAIISVTNYGEPPVLISSVRFPISSWSNKPKLLIPRYLKLRRVLDHLFGRNPLHFYVSDPVCTYDRDLKEPLTTGQTITASIPLEDMIETLISNNGYLFGNATLNSLYLGKISIHVVTTRDINFSAKAMWEIRYYLKEKYGKDKRLMGVAT